MKSQYPAAIISVRDWLECHRLRAGTSLPSAQKLATLLGFTPATMLRACQSMVVSGFLDRKGNKLFVGPGRRVSAGIEGTVHVLSYDDSFSRTCGNYFAQRGIECRVTHDDSLRHGIVPFLERVSTPQTAGLILRTVAFDPAGRRHLEASRIPSIVTLTNLKDLGVSAVRTDLNGAAEKAVRHLLDLGHRELAYAWYGLSESTRLCHEGYRAACLNLGLKSSVARIWHAKAETDQAVAEAIALGRRRHPGVTGIFGDVRFGMAATRAFRLPDELSVVGMYDLEESAGTRPPMTTVTGADLELEALLTCAALEAQMQAVQAGRPARPPSHLLLVPEVIVRGSTRAADPVRPPAPAEKKTRAAGAEDPAQTWRKVYPLVKRTAAPEWHPFDLGPLANHSMTRRNGWLGSEPLRYFPSGAHRIHGVPFQVLDEKRHDGRAVVTFRSPQTHLARDRELPVSIRIRAKMSVRALYFLHGCGYARAGAFARYEVQFRGGGSVSVPLMPLGGPGREETGPDRRANIQDWWPTLEHRDFPHAHRVTVFDPAHPQAYQRVLYTLEWINPRPKEEITAITVRVDPEAGPTLALIAVTALL